MSSSVDAQKTPTNSLEGFTAVIGAIALALAVFMQVLDTTIANVCIPYIAGDLAVSKTIATWVITMFAAGNSIFLPLTGWLTRRFGNVRIMVGSTAAFTFMSWVCGASPSFDILVIARFFQGAAAGPLIPLSLSLMIMAFGPKRKNIAVAMWTSVALVGPILGPILGGWIVLNHTWHWIFLINIPFGILSCIITWVIFSKNESETHKEPIDYIGFICLAVFVTSFQIMLDKGQQYDWWRSDFIITLTALAAISFIALLLWELTETHPIIDLSLFKDLNFSLGTALTAFSYVTLFGAIVLSPLWLQTTMGYDAYWAGLATAPMGIVPILLSRFVAFALDRYPPRYILAFCFFTLALVYYYFTFFTTSVSFEVVCFSRLLFGIPITMWLPALTAISFAYIPEHRLTMATGIFHFIRMMFGGLGTSIVVTLWQRRAALHQDNITFYTTPYNDLVTGALKTLKESGFSSMQSTQVLYDSVLQQSLMLSTNDVFYVMAGLSVLFFIASFIFKPKSKAPKKEATPVAAE